MGNKPAININRNFIQNKTTSISSPFWNSAPIKKNNAKIIFAQIWKWFKLIILLFFLLMGLWGCAQSMWDPNIKTSSVVGEGMEFGYSIGTTGDYRYDLISNGTPGYFAFDSFTMQFGPFFGLFVYPGAWFATFFSYLGRNWWGGLNVLLAIFLLLLLIRGLSIAISLRSTLQNEKMSEIQGKVSEINAKYKGLNDSFSKQQKSKEIMELYKKNKVKPFAAFEQMMITLPIFMIIYRVITICRPMKTTTLFGIWNFASVPTTEIFSNFANGGWLYIFLILIVVPVQFISMKLPQMLAKKRNRNAQAVSVAGNKQMKKTKMIQLIFSIVMCVVVIFSATGVAVYWFLSACFTMAQTAIMHALITRNKKKGGTLDSKLNKIFNV